MAKRKSTDAKQHHFRDKLLLNQWVISLFGIDPLIEYKRNSQVLRPLHLLVDAIKDSQLEGFDHDKLHRFYHELSASHFFRSDQCRISPEQLLNFEENIARHTQTINEKRRRPVVWKYYQWLTLLFVEIYLDRYFSNPEGLIVELNVYVEHFNRHWGQDYAKLPVYNEDDLNKLCLQNATGSGKTLLMHVNLLQYCHYANKHGKENDLSRVILLTPNERLSEQHITELCASGISAENFLHSRNDMLGAAQGLGRVDVLEITKLADQEGPNTLATRSLGDQNLLLVDEGHRGMSGKEEGIWFTRRSNLCANGFTFEYSATFEQAVQASGSIDFENSYAKAVLFDYSYRWFYEDGFGKDYQILNLPKSFEENQSIYMTACLLKFYQQLRIYEENAKGFESFNLEKPLWVFVGSTVSSRKMGKDEQIVVTDVALIIQFIAIFLDNRQLAIRRIRNILSGTGRDTGLLDRDGNDIFASAFNYLAQAMNNNGETPEILYQDILRRLFNSATGGTLLLDRIKGESGEVALRVGASEIPFGLINVGDAKTLCDHIAEVAAQNNIPLTVEDSDFTEAMFVQVKDSTSSVNLLIGSKKFVEGWDCWRVSTMGLMHVGRSEGSQIIQLFGRGVRLKGYEWSLKRSSHSHVTVRPAFIGELETLNIFGIEADFMEKFREFLGKEALPGNEHRKIITIPLNVTYDFGKKLKILRPKHKASSSREYDFKKDARIPTIGEVFDYLRKNPILSDWYPRIQAIQSFNTNLTIRKDKVEFLEKHLTLLDYDALFFELEQFKQDRGWHNLNISKEGINCLLKDASWYTLYLPEIRMNPSNFDGILLLQQVATELLKGYCRHYYNYRKREFIEPRLELRELTRDDDNFPREEFYQLIVDGDEGQIISAIEKIKKELEAGKDELLTVGDLKVCNFGKHFFQPLFHVRRSGKITILPVVLNESEYQFVTDLKQWYDNKKADFEKEHIEFFLLRNMSRDKGVGFFEAGGFHPDFILWVLMGGKQYVTFIEPHGLLHEGVGSEKILFYKRIKDIEKRLKEKTPDIVLNSFILSWTSYTQLQWDKTREELDEMHILFMRDDSEYIDNIFYKLNREMSILT